MTKRSARGHWHPERVHTDVCVHSDETAMCDVMVSRSGVHAVDAVHRVRRVLHRANDIRESEFVGGVDSPRAAATAPKLLPGFHGP